MTSAKIKTSHVYPPIPIRTHDWCAYIDGEENAANTAGAAPSRKPSTTSWPSTANPIQRSADMNALTKQMRLLADTLTQARRIPMPGTDYMVTASSFTSLGGRHTVLFEGELYVVNDHLLAAMKRGETPFDLELDPEEIDEEME